MRYSELASIINENVLNQEARISLDLIPSKTVSGKWQVAMKTPGQVYKHHAAFSENDIRGIRTEFDRYEYDHFKAVLPSDLIPVLDKAVQKEIWYARENEMKFETFRERVKSFDMGMN